jgi:hypothetical protein
MKLMADTTEIQKQDSSLPGCENLSAGVSSGGGICFMSSPDVDWIHSDGFREWEILARAKPAN